MGALQYAGQLVAAARELHLHPAMVACIVLAVAGLFHWAVLSLNFLVARRQAEEEPKPQARPAATTAAPTAPASRLAHPHFLVLCLIVGALPYAEQLVTAAGELHLHPAMVACIVLAVAGLFHWAVLSLNFLVARRQAEEEPKPQARPAATTAAPTASASRLARPHFLVLCLVVGVLPYTEQLETAAGELHLHPAMVACIVLAVAGFFHWAVLSLNLLVARRQAEEELKPQARPAATTAAPTAPASRLARPHFLVLCLVVGVLPYAEQLVTAAGELHLHPAMVACIVLAVAGLFHWAVLSLNFLVARRQAEEEPKPQARPAATTAAPTASVSRLARPHFLVLCLVVGVLPYTEQFVTAAGELHLHPAMVACIVLAVAGLFHWAVLSLNFLVARRQAEEEVEPKPQARPAATTAAPTASVSRLARPHFLVLCLVVGVLPYAEQFVTAAGELHLHPAMVACIVLAVAGLFHWAVLSLNFLVARRQAEEEPKPQARPAATTAAPTASASRLARPHFLVLCLVVGVLPYTEQLETAAGELHLHPAMVACIVLAVAGFFHWAVLSLNLLVARRQAEEELKPQARPAATTAAPTAPASRLAHPHFLVLCLVLGALPYAEQLVIAAGELHLHPALVACIVLAVAGLFDWAVLSLNFPVARRQAEEEPKPQARPAATTAAPTASA